MRFICAQPAKLRFAWQVEVMINNFIEMGVDPNYIDVVCCIEHGIPYDWVKMANAYPVRFFFYPDTRITRHYASSTRPNALKQHFAEHPYLKDEAIFYHDCDIIFTRPIKEWIHPAQEKDMFCYGSNTGGYINSRYIDSYGYDWLEKMCKIVDISPSVVRENNHNCIGAQYLLKGIDSGFWERIERDSEILYKKINDEILSIVNNDRRKWLITREGKEPHKNHHLQIWCADMWALLWNLWKDNKKTVCPKSFDFSWATDSEKTFEERNIFHNAGSVPVFIKGDYQNSTPYGTNLNVTPGASRRYYEYVIKVGKNTCLK